ncbi:ABC transporter ATP-binding protein [Paenibacillus sp. J2TS4]|uniref:ABC transporter ATP-binding protein n=1 Tax=Paenibacillus sp. J2TS4 TaxID=2807194 RepID=UPI001B187FA5|nr:ABC transporter ATP-binding protein [Paenibacillus sp. J2TS4]GIP32906.1 ABC transporter ATP-binding protein [Paenibacillus sp. J2TS4]
MSEPIIELVDLTKKYGEKTAVNQLNLSIHKGEIFGLLGPNGAGKSTTILMMIGLSEPTSGLVKVCGFNSTRQPMMVKKRVGYLPDDVGFYDELSARDNLIYTARLNRIPAIEAAVRADLLLERVGLGQAKRQKAGTFSRGMRQRLGLADVLIKRPEIIILDEPTLGIDPEGVREFLDLIRTLSRDEGLTVLLSSHHLHQVQQICDRVGIFVQGRLIAQGTIESLSRELFAGEPLVIEVEAAALTNEMEEAVRGIEHVLRVEREGQRLRLGCAQDVSSQVAHTLVQQGAALTGLSKKQYGLDEIYHRYFEGSDSDEGEGSRMGASRAKAARKGI